MQAVVAQRYGGPEVLALVERPRPEPGPRDVRIAVKAASLNPVDFKIRDGKTKLVLAVKPPIALGCDVAGVVDAVGAEVTRFRVDDEVFARLEKNRMGGFAEHVCADESVVAKKPAAITFAEAAAIPLAGLTSLQALREVAALTQGQRVIIHAGAGGVGSLAIQIAKILGLHVIATTTLPGEVDAVFDTLGTTELASIAATKRGGTVVGVGGLPDAEFARNWLPFFVRPALWLMTGKRRRAANRRGVRFAYLFMRPDGAELAELGAWIDAKKLRPILHATFPLAQFAEAFAELDRGRARGKIVLTLG
ncbi:MAG: NADP-dependent oxidoreductase [Deltaproteobacteria bacterium]|nr:NADP-dependent oxidoreductase [Deltaproteobacteria bacterium]